MNGLVGKTNGLSLTVPRVENKLCRMLVHTHNMAVPQTLLGLELSTSYLPLSSSSITIHTHTHTHSHTHTSLLYSVQTETNQRVAVVSLNV